MLIFESDEKSGRLDIETKAYFSGENTVSINQYLFDGPDVISTSEVNLTLDQLFKILTLSSRAHINKFLKDYKLDGGDI